MSSFAELSSLLKTATSIRETLQVAAKNTAGKSGHVAQELQHRLVDLWGREQALVAVLTDASLSSAGLASFRSGLSEQLLELLKFSGELGCLKESCQPIEAALAQLAAMPKNDDISKLIETALR